MTLPLAGGPGVWTRMTVMNRVGTLHALIGILVTIAILLVAMHFVSRRLVPPLNRLEIWFNMNREGTIAAWFASSQLFAVGVILGLVGLYRRGQDRPSPAFFGSLGLLFIALSVDEAVGIHERVTLFLVDHAWVPRFRGDHGVWMFFYAILGVVVVVLMRRNLVAFWRRYRTPARTMLAGLAVAVAGGIGLELVYYYVEHRAAPVVEEIQAAAEEFLEMVGITVVLLGVIQLSRRTVRLQSIA